jgi:hypothetical protein
MTLPSSGTISFFDINIELQRSGTATLDLESAAADSTVQNCATPYPDPANPDAITEWYGYNHNLTASLQSTVITSNTSCDDACTYSSCGFSGVDLYKYVPSGKYYWYGAGLRCKTATGFFTYSAVCSGGSRLGQSCYQFNVDRTLASTVTCTTTTTTTTTTATCQCLSNTCSSTCYNNGCFCYDVNDCNFPASCI